MAYSDTSISIHLVKDRNNEKLDDIIRIIKNLEDNVFELTYKDNGDPLMHKVRYMTRDNASDYLYFLLKNLSVDEDGYQHIQFSLPAMPRVLIAGSRLTDSSFREHFLELIECGIGLLDKVEKLSIKKPVENTTKFSYNHYVGSSDKNKCNVYSSCGKCNSTLPTLPASPVHTYFE